MFDIAIVGLGGTGVSLIKQIHEQVHNLNLPTPKIAIFDENITFSRGNAFGVVDDIHKVNTPSSMLALSQNAPTEFTDWLLERGVAETYPVRSLYADFLSYSYKLVLNDGILNIDEFYEKVKYIKKENNYFYISSENYSIKAKKVILCLGALSSSNFSFQYNISNDWKEINGVVDSTVLVAGTGLTAVDIVRTLAKNQNTIHLFSRNGFAPTCLRVNNENKYMPKFLTWENLIEKTNKSGYLNLFFSLLHEECESISEINECKFGLELLNHYNIHEYFSFLMKQSHNSCLPYQDILVSTRLYMHKFWLKLSQEERQKFQKVFSSHWSAWRHPIPYEVIQELYELSLNKQLFIHQCVDIRKTSREYILSTKKGEYIKSPLFIDGTGGDNNINNISSPLIKNLLLEKLIEPNNSGGININPVSYNCVVNQKNIPNLYSLGALNRGVLFSTNAQWFNVQCAAYWVEQWVLEILNNQVGN